MVSGYIRKPRVFNPRLREGGDIFLTFCNHLLYFQSTPPRRRRPAKINRILRQFVFNPRLREGGDNECTARSSPGIVFNPRLREGGDDLADRGATNEIFSIHASAKEATEREKCQRVLKMFSIHASAKEATIAAKTFPYFIFFSIHASAKEATATYCNTPAIMCISSLNNFFVHHF